MADYKAPLKDIRFVMNEVFGAEQLWASLAGTKDTIDIETADAVLEEAGKITASLIAPLSREGDEEGCQWNEGEVTTPQGYVDAYKTFVEGGWSGLTGNPEFEGMGMPKMVGAQYMLYGNLSSIVKKDGSDEDVYYKMTMRLMDLESGLIEWADETEIRKQESKSLFGL